MAICCNFSGFIIVAIVAIPTFLALLDASGLCGNYPITKTMPLGRDVLLCNQNFITGSAMFSLSLACSGAGCFYSLIDDFYMSICSNLSGFIMVAITTISAFLPLLRAGRLHDNYPIIETVTLGRDFLLGDDNCVAD